jgi:two-component system sensor histidine kinase QseC
LNSIRVFLVVVILAVMTLFTFVAALRGYQSSMLEAERLFDKQLLDTARLIAHIQTDKTAVNVNRDADIAFQVWEGEELKASSSNAPPEAMAALKPGFDFSNFGAYRWRTVAYLDADSGYWVLAAERTDLRYTLADNVILESILPVFMGLPLVGLLIWVIVSQGLKPLRRLADELGNKQPVDLSPLSIQAPKSELKQIVESCNGLLERLETSLLREKQFASDAAHELRTPISVLKVQLYNISQELPRDSENIERLESTAERLEHIVEQILDLYRASPDQFMANFQPIDLTGLVQESLAGEYANFDRKAQAVEFEGEPCVISGDEFALVTLVQNLLSNANKYTPEGGQVLVSIHSDEAGVTLVVEDSGPGIPQSLRGDIFERFYRVGGDRHQSGEPGCGLGLAIVKRIVDLHSASIEVVDSRFDSGTAFRVTFPPGPLLPHFKPGGQPPHA